MALIVEMPIDHPARRSNPFNLKKSAEVPTKAGLDCPSGCGQSFEGHWKLYLHLLERHPEQRDAKA
jgi:hypothetical protein